MLRRSVLIFGAPRIEEDEIQEVVDSLRSGWLSTGPKVKKFEEAFKKYMWVSNAVAVNSCTAALFLSLKAVGVESGDEVITTPLSFAATANVILHCGAKPVFADVDRLTMNIDPEEIKKKVTRHTKAVIPVHFAGRPCNMEALLHLAQRHRLFVIQDAAHALEARYHEKRIAQIGDLAAFSFYATKNLTTGEGGMVTSRRRDWAEKIQVLACQGMTKMAWRRYSDKGYKHYKIVLPGFKFNMMDIQAGIGLHQLRRIESYLRLRGKIWQEYDQAFQGLPLSIAPPAEKNTRHARHLYTILLDLGALRISRDRFQHELYKRKIGTGIHFISLHLQPYYRKIFNFKPADFPNASDISKRTLSLPLSAKLTPEDVQDVIEAVRETVKKYKR